jgi:hypothetical protein
MIADIHPGGMSFIMGTRLLRLKTRWKNSIPLAVAAGQAYL